MQRLWRIQLLLVAAAGLACAPTDGLSPGLRSSEGTINADLRSSVVTSLVWDVRAPFLGGVRAAAATWDGSRIYVLGGNEGAASYTSANRIYNPAANTWTSGAQFTGPRDFAVAASMKDGIHMLGGAGPAGFLADHQVYQRSTNSWSSRARLPIGVDAAVAWAWEGRLYIIGGASAPATPVGAVQIFNLATNSWSFGAPMPTARLSSASAVIDGTIYVAGGQTTGVGTTAALERYDPRSNSWTILAPMPDPREALGGGAVAGQFCVFGGRIANPSPTGDARPETFCYDPGSGAWTRVRDMITARVEVASVTLDGVVYALGGRTPAAFAVGTNELLHSVRSTTSP